MEIEYSPRNAPFDTKKITAKIGYPTDILGLYAARTGCKMSKDSSFDK